MGSGQTCWRAEMIDLHCHLLPGIDDGPASMDDAVAMARMACKNGVQKAVVTPHMHPGRYDNDVHSIKRAVAEFRLELERLAIPLVLGFAAEVRISPEIITLVESGEMPYLGEHEGYRIMLLEFPHSHIPVGSEQIVAWLLERRVRPMIAHPERNKDVIRHLDKIAPFVEMGCLLQVTAGAAAGTFGAPAMHRARELLERGWVSILASDAHNLDVRRPELEPGRAIAETIVGAAASWALVRDMPRKISQVQFAAE
jgi:protein-tyrosine phosphatase